jgi:uncharacterized protein (TIGR03083 family)
MEPPAVYPISPITTLPLFPPLSAALLALLRNLAPDDWQRPTVCGDWTVKDVAAHLLGGNLGRLSFQRDGLTRSRVSAAPVSNAELLDVINRANAEWVSAARRISPPVLVDFLALTDPQVYDFFATLPPDAPANIGVSWAGEARSPNWFDIAREYTEKWLHQQHIRDAVARPGLTERQWLFPVLDTFMRALPFTYRDVSAPDGISLTVTLSGDAGGDWSLLREDGLWHLFAGAAPSPSAHVRLDADTAWRLFTKGLTPAAGLPSMHFAGDRALGEHVLHMVSIVA